MEKIFKQAFAREDGLEQIIIGDDSETGSEEFTVTNEQGSSESGSHRQNVNEFYKEQNRIRELLLTLLSLSKGTFSYVKPKIDFDSSIGSIDIENFRIKNNDEYRESSKSFKGQPSILERSNAESKVIRNTDSV